MEHQGEGIFLPPVTIFSKLILNVDYNNSGNAPPVDPRESSVFVVDKHLYQDWKHTSSTWKNQVSKYRTFREKDGEDGWLIEKVPSKEVIKRCQDIGDCYLMKQTYYKHGNPKYSEVRKMISEVQTFNSTDNKLEDTNFGLIQYVFPDGRIITLSPNKRKGKQFIPTAPSTKKKIIEAAKSNLGPRTIAAELSGNILQHKVPGTTPRNVQQIKNFRTSLQNKKTDEFNELLQFSHHNRVGQKTIHNLQFTRKGIRFVYCLEPQLKEIISLCTSLDSDCGILSIDTTFNVGNFYMTPTCYTIPSIINSRTNKPINMPGPCLFHIEEEDRSVYLYFAHSLIQMNEDIDKIRFVGGDRGKGQLGFLHPLRSAILLPCTWHLQNNMKQHVSDQEVCSKIFKDIFGSFSHKTKGLVDYERKDFDEAVDKMKKDWPQDFVNYFQVNVEKDIKEGMLIDVRRAAGLRDTFYYNNALECLNKKIKTKKAEMQLRTISGVPVKKPCTLIQGVEIYHNLLLEERKYMQSAVIGKGPYKLAPDFENLFVDETKYCQMNIEEKKCALAKVDPFIKDYDFNDYV